MKLLYTLTFLLFFPLLLSAEQKPTLEAIRIEQAIKVDGILDDSAWGEAPVGGDFTNLQPVLDVKPQQKTEVRVIYNDVFFNAVEQRKSALVRNS